VDLRPELAAYDPDALEQVACDALYSHYVRRQDDEIARMQRDEAVVIPAELDYGTIDGLSSELKGKLEASRPETLAQAGRIEGMTPAALTLLLARIRREQKLSA
jgi:tRNA uridine 5-carboxymethylaminomethyl modification enzyme